MWTVIVRIFLTVVLSIAFLILFGGKNIKRYQEGGTSKIRDEVKIKAKDIPIPGNNFSFEKQDQKSIRSATQCYCAAMLHAAVLMCCRASVLQC